MLRFALRLATATALVLGLAAVQPAAAQGPVQGAACAKHADILRHLGEKFSEAPSARGVTETGALLEVFTSTDGSTWSVVITIPGGPACLVATGESWEAVPRVAFGPPA